MTDEAEAPATSRVSGMRELRSAIISRGADEDAALGSFKRKTVRVPASRTQAGGGGGVGREFPPL